MANHAHVYTTKEMTQESISALLDDLNRDVFHGVLNISCTLQKLTWPVTEEGKPFWEITIKGQRKDGDYRQFWLNSPTSFEIRHGGGSDFIWWVDFVITDAVSNMFDGHIQDDSGAGYDKVVKSFNTPLTYREYVLKVVEKRTRDARFMRFLCFKLMLSATPKEYFKAARMRQKLSPEELK